MVAIFGADHIYRMNIREMIEFHMHRRAQVTIAAVPVDRALAQNVFPGSDGVKPMPGLVG